MNSHPISRRRLLSSTFLAFGTAHLAACGGGGEADAGATPASEDGVANALGASRSTKVTPIKAAPAPAPAPAPALGTPFTSLVLGPVEGAGATAYAATLLPLPGQVPAAATVSSPDDTSMAAAVLSRWPDGSAAVIVVGGVAQATGAAGQSLRVATAAAASAPAPLTPARVGQLVQSVQVAFGSLGTATLTQFGSPERVWWAHGQSICARYRVPAPGHATLEAVIDIQAFAADCALVEVVVENSRMNSANPVRPGNASYTAEVFVNSRSVGSARSSDAPEGTHAAFRAWHVSAWVGTQRRVPATQLHTDLQKHPLFFRVDQPGGDMSFYASDRYTPWGAVRQRPSNMGGTGDHPGIGPLARWDSHFLQSGSPLAANSVEANALAILGFNLCYRDSSTGLVPNAAQLVGRDRHYNWPGTDNPEDRLCWETAHHPGAGLMAFVCRPSPVFIEIAQRIVVMNATWSGGGLDGFNMAGWGGTGITDSTGVYGYWYQTRGRAWGLRSLVHATFLTPETPHGQAWRDGGKYWLNLNRIYLAEWSRKPAAAALNVFWDYAPNDPASHGSGAWQVAGWQNHFLITELHKAASARLLAGTEQTALDGLADWAAMLPVRWVNEQPDGGWRYITYTQKIAPQVNPNAPLPANWGTVMRQFVSAAPPSVAGPISVLDGATSEYATFGTNTTAGAFYPSIWWAALVAAVERNVPGAAQAWNTVQTQSTNLATWRRGFVNEPRWGASPRTVGGLPVAAPVPEVLPSVVVAPMELSPQNAPWYLAQLTPEFIQYGWPLTLESAYRHWREWGRAQGRKWAPDAPAPAWGPAWAERPPG